VSSPDLRLIVITDVGAAGGRSLDAVISAALVAGAPAIQLRDKTASARELHASAVRLLPLVHAHGAKLLINDRLDVALAAGADGVHIGPGDIPLEAARQIAPAGFLIGVSTDDPAAARAAEAAGADYIGCGAVFGTTSKPELGGERIGTDRLDSVARAVRIPVVGIGGITGDNVAEVAATAAAGVAVIGAVMATADPERATRTLLAAFPPDRSAAADRRSLP
jgi:thiamine-phosphate pyrophosphorylase